MDVVLVVVGTAVVDHQDQLLDVQTSGCHRGCHHKATRSILKVVDDAVSVVLVNSYKDGMKGTYKRPNISKPMPLLHNLFTMGAFLWYVTEV